MDIFDQKQVLKSMVILADTREQQTKRALDRYARFGCPYRRATLSYGDYGYNCLLPSGEWLYDENNTVSCHLAVERKMDLTELAGCFGKSRERFQREFQRAQEADARIFLLVENSTWENLINGKYRSKMHPHALLASVTAWTIRYNINLIFCKEETSGALIKELLYRDLKERLEKGELDNV